MSASLARAAKLHKKENAGETGQKGAGQESYRRCEALPLRGSGGPALYAGRYNIRKSVTEAAVSYEGSVTSFSPILIALSRSQIPAELPPAFAKPRPVRIGESALVELGVHMLPSREL